MITKSNTVVEIKTEDLFGKATLRIVAEKDMKGACLTVTDADGKRSEFAFTGSGKVLEGEFQIENAHLWNVSDPYLYAFSVSIAYENETETAEGRFGFRTISTNGKEMCVNGTPVFVRGFIRGATAHDHSNNCGLSEEEFYRKNIKMAKKFGFNFVRFHSVVPSETYFKVADEEGILVHIELRMPDDIYNNLREMTSTGNMLVPDEYLREVIHRLYNHPSLAVYCIGNEIRHLATSNRVNEIYQIITEEDDTRLFLDTCAWGRNNRPNVDVDVQHMSYYFPFGKHADMFEDSENLLVVGTEEDKPLVVEGEESSVSRCLYFKVPLFAHEVCHYTALRDYKSLKAKFEKYGAPQPWWIDEELKMIKAKGYEEAYDEMYSASKYFQFECWKTGFEALRSSRLLGGFHFLQFADTDVYENSNGVVDCFDDASHTDPEKFAYFNGDRVLIAKLGSRLFYAGEQIAVPVMFSGCGEDVEKVADLSFSLKRENGETVAKGGMKNLDVSRKGLYDLCKIRLNLPKTETSERLTLEIALTCAEKTYSKNVWKIWTHNNTARLTYKDFVTYEEKGVMITDDIEKALQGVKAGKKVCLVYRSNWTRHVADKTQEAPMYAFKASWNRFKPVIWDRGTNYGGLCENELLEKYGFASERFFDFNYNVVSEDCDKINLDDFPCKVETLVSGIDKSCRDRFDAYKDCFNQPELMYDRTLRNFAYLFGLKVGEGKLLVCGFNMTGLDDNEPSTKSMASFIKAYMHSADFDPKVGTDVETLTAYLKKSAEKPVKESIMTQFWALDDTPVESSQFWKDSRLYLKDVR